MEKKWSTAADELVCPICGTLHNTSAPMHVMFEKEKIRHFLPPAHPRCRCTVIYEEIAGTNTPNAWQNPRESDIMNHVDVNEYRQDLYARIDSKNKPDAYKQKLKDVFEYLVSQGYIFSEHALGRVVGQKTGKGKRNFTLEEVLQYLALPINYMDGDMKAVRFYEGIAIIQALDTGEIVSIISNLEPSTRWKKV